MSFSLTIRNNWLLKLNSSNAQDLRRANKQLHSHTKTVFWTPLIYIYIYISHGDELKSTRLVKACYDEFTVSLTYLINMSFDKMLVSRWIKQSIVRPTYKIRNRKDRTNYLIELHPSFQLWENSSESNKNWTEFNLWNIATFCHQNNMVFEIAYQPFIPFTIVYIPLWIHWPVKAVQLQRA